MKRITKIGTAATLAAGLLVTLEGYPGKPYRDIAGIWTDCYGNTKNVSPDKIRSDAECSALLKGEAQRIAEKIESRLKYEASTRTLASFVSFAYNVGDSAFFRSSVYRLWNEGKFEQACQAMFLWTKVTIDGVKVHSKGLYNRRKIEHSYCIEGLL